MRNCGEEENIEEQLSFGSRDSLTLVVFLRGDEKEGEWKVEEVEEVEEFRVPILCKEIINIVIITMAVRPIINQAVLIVSF